MTLATITMTPTHDRSDARAAAATPPARSETLPAEGSTMSAHDLSTLTRATIVAASFVATSLTLAAVGLAFDAASAPPWLRDTPEARREFARCAAIAERPARRDCLHTIVADARARDAGRLRLAGPVRDTSSVGEGAR